MAKNDTRPYLRDDWYWSPNELKRLWGAVLQLAITDASDGPGDWEDYSEGQRDKIRKAARKWIASDAKAVRSFLWVCAVLELEPLWVRRLVADAVKGKQ